MLSALIVVVVLAIVFSSASSAVTSPRDILLNKVLLAMRDKASSYLSSIGAPIEPSLENPYYNFIPMYAGSLQLRSKGASWASKCFNSNTATLSKDGNTMTIKIVSSGAKSQDKLCEDYYLFGTTNIMQLASVVDKLGSPLVQSTVVLTIPDDATDAENWDLEKKGVRVYQFPNDIKTSASNLIKTFELFIPQMTQRVPKDVAELNIDFMRRYPGFDIEPRDPTSQLPPPESHVKSGDAFYVMRLDGLNPMLAWAMGSTTGHTTAALWIDNELYIVESDVTSSYWPTDGVQKTPYKTWMKQAEMADYQVVWAPLSEESRKAFNETAAVEFFRSVEGLEYGYETLLFGWMDVGKDNMPCLPPDYSSYCLQWELIEPLFAYIDRFAPDVVDLLLNVGYNIRLGTTGLRTAELYKEADKQGYQSFDVMQIVERDDWLYPTTRYGEPVMGKNMVCCVFVCNLWKAAGVFGDLGSEINCGEMTNWDDYSLTIHASHNVQVLGHYTLKLNDYKTKTPYAHMAEHCPSKAPDYTKPDNC